ncbi:MAG: efflux RND transporter periplasmic adaptor subunit [Treponema sp.]|nr:efflux RND transporter periplasmic adaptor subunit [Treponema sp.]
MKRPPIWLKTVIACMVIALSMPACSGNKPGGTSYEFTDVRRGTLERTVSASGTINPISTIRVLPQMSGKVERVFVDFNDQVSRGDILAELNTEVLRLRREQQRATVQKARSSYTLHEFNYQNLRTLAESNPYFTTENELRSSRTTLDNLRADLSVAESNLRVIETEINEYAYIRSPIDGIVLDRRINVGDTVVDSSSNNSSNIFTLAENLREMQIEATVGELDIASIQEGQAVRFTLESLPGRTFTGEVESKRLIPVVSNNVVSYTVIVKVENLDGSLLPGMTCAVDFIIERSENVLMVSNAALRYRPTSLAEERIDDMIFTASLQNMSEERQQAAIEARERTRAEQAQSQGQNSNTGLQNLMMGGAQTFRIPGQGGGRQGQAGRQGSGQNGRESPAVVMRNLWYINGDGRLEVVQVRIGISSGSLTEVIGVDDLEGQQVILRERI